VEGKPAGAPLLHLDYTTGPPPPNVGPVVDAGVDGLVTLPSGASLDGSVSDDGRPSGVLTSGWSVVSGPGSVVFGDVSAVDTVATFGAAGTYVLRLSASDGALSSSDTVQVVVQAAPAGSATVERRVSEGSDDVEESATGSLSGSSSDLELVDDGGNQLVGLRFPSMAVPVGATVTRAYVQFEADEAQSEATSLMLWGQAADNPVTFSSSNKVSTRPRTTVSAGWAPPVWSTVSEAGAAQRTVDLSAVVQQVVSRPGWASGNAIVLIIGGTGHRTARAVEGKPAGAPLLHLEYTTGG
jgi:hypothetical protein